MTPFKRHLNNKDLLRLLDQATLDALDVKSNTVLVLKTPELYLPEICAHIAQDVQSIILANTGYLVAVLVMRKDLDIDQAEESELLEMRQRIDLMLAHLGRKKTLKESAN